MTRVILDAMGAPELAEQWLNGNYSTVIRALSRRQSTADALALMAETAITLRDVRVYPIGLDKQFLRYVSTKLREAQS